jgi:hypothetical protein
MSLPQNKESRSNDINSIKSRSARVTLWHNTPVTKAFDRDVGIIDMHIEDMLWAICGKYLNVFLSSLVTLALQIFT